MNGLTFTESVLLALALGGVAAGIGLVILGLLFADGGLLAEKDDREDSGLDILDPRDRGTNDDATEEQLYAFADMLEEDDLADDVTQELPALSERSLQILRAARARTQIARSPIRRDWREPPPPVARPSRPGPVTVEFGRITGHNPAAGVGPDEQLTLDLGVVS